MVSGLSALGIEIDADWNRGTLVVHGCRGKLPATSGEIYAANSGTSIRFLTALATLGHGEFRLSGVPRMHERPIGDLLSALEQLGANAQSESANGCPPVRISANGLQGGNAKIRANLSSQFLSALLMVAPYTRTPTTLTLDGPLVSRPYIAMTVDVMRHFGITVTMDPMLQSFSIPPAIYTAREFEIEPDASAASYFFAAAAITGGRVEVTHLNRDSIQGDVAFVGALEKMGADVTYLPNSIVVQGRASQGITIDMNQMSDTAQTLAAVALFADSPTTIRGVAHNRFKETDRIGNLATELRKLGATVDVLEDGMTITPGPYRGDTLETYDDHRMAMSLSLAGLKIPGVKILDPDCTRKTYPNFFSDLETICRRDGLS